MKKPSIYFWIVAAIFLLGATYEGGIMILNGGANSYGDMTIKTGDLVVDVGDISATAGSVSANTTVTAGTDLVATAGSVSAATTVLAGTGISSTLGDIHAVAGSGIFDGGNIGITGDLDLLALAAAALTVNGSSTLTNAGGDANSYKLVLEAHMAAGDETQTSSIRTAWGLDPYMIIATPNATGVETDVVHLDTASLRCAADGQIDLGATGAGRFKDIFLSGNLDAEVGSIVSQVDITADTGNIVATTGSVSAGTTVTAGTGISTAVGDVTSSAGNQVDQYANVRMARPIVDADVPSEPFSCVAGTYGWIIPVDDTNDAGASWLCWCARIDDIGGYAWRKVSDEGSCY